jgi:hypothetical protein
MVEGERIEWSGDGGVEYDRGNSPDIVLLGGEIILEVHKGTYEDQADALFCRLGKIYENKIEWMRTTGSRYDRGGSPAIATCDGDTVFEVHDGGDVNDDLHYRIGKYKNGQLIWVGKGGYPYDKGFCPSVAVVPKIRSTVEVHCASTSNETLYYNLGQLV